jgi:hypothetical protein
MHLQETSPSQIEEGLTRIWDALESSNKIRASLFNLIIYAERDRRDAYLHTIAQRVIEKFPSRVIYISVDKESGKDFLKTSVSVMSAGKEENAIACDLIQIEVAGVHQARVPFLILPHILPDLPVYLVWAEDLLCKNALFAQLEKFATRLIFDSESTSDLPRFASRVLEHAKDDQIDVVDLNWARRESWRDLFSTSFYSDEALSQLRRINSLQIEYNAHETAFFYHTRIQAIYLQAWLACQLEWKLEKASLEEATTHFSYKRGEDPIAITFVPHDYPTLSPGIITAVEMQTSQGEHFSFARDKEVPNYITIHIFSKDQCELPMQFIFTKAESGQSLVKEICRQGTSDHYLKVLKLISTYAGSAAPAGYAGLEKR